MPRDLLVSSDLMFSSQLCQAALDCGVDLRVVGGRELPDALQGETLRKVFIDLNCPSVDAVEIQQHLAGLDPAPQTIAYANHVRDDLLAAAKAAGFDLILTRGQFHAQMRELLR